MSQAFLPTYRKLCQASSNDALTVAGLWLAHGDEPLLSTWLTDAMRPHWQAQGQQISRIELLSAKTWQEVVAELNSLSLFDPANAVVVTGNHKPDKAAQEQLITFAQQSEAGNTEAQSCLLWLTGMQDYRSLKAKWIAPFAEYGTIVDCHLQNERQRHDILRFKASQLNINLDDEAWQLLFLHTQNNLLDAYQTLWRLSFLFIETDAGLLGADELQAALVEGSQFTVFDLSDAMLQGNAGQVVHIIDTLRHSDEPAALVLWVIEKDMRLIQQLLAGTPMQSLGIWRSKQSLYQSACRRLQGYDTQSWASLLLECDKAIKGVIAKPAWESLLQAALQVCAVDLLLA